MLSNPIFHHLYGNIQDNNNKKKKPQIRVIKRATKPYLIKSLAIGEGD